MSPRRSRALALLVAGGLALTACGGDDDNGSDGAAEQSQEPPAQTTGGGGGDEVVSQVALSEYKFDPSDVTAKAGSTITVRNEGSLAHDLKLRKGGDEVGGTEVFPAGEERKLKVDFAPDAYEMFCSVPGHEQSGMKGTFTVK